jgi:importin-5
LTLTLLVTTNPTLFQPHLWPLLGFLPALIFPSTNPGLTPTVVKPFTTSGSFTFPLAAGGSQVGDDTDKDWMVMDEEIEDIRKAALEFMISLSEKG